MAYDVLRPTIAPRLLRRIGSIEGEQYIPSHGPFILASNHISYIEPPLLAILAVLRTNQKVYSFTKLSVWRVFHALGLAGWLGMVAVDPHNKQRCIDECVQHLRNGAPVLIFPEGKRIFSQELGQGKTGIARLAARTGAPVIPVGYQGPVCATTVASVRNYIFRPKSIHIAVGQPITIPATANPDHSFLEEHTRRVMIAVGQLCHRPYPYYHGST